MDYSRLTWKYLLDRLPLQTDALIQRRWEWIEPFFHLVSIEEVCEAFDADACIALHKDFHTWNDREPESYGHLIAHALLWRCNIQGPVKPARQYAFVKKQDAIIRQYWSEVLAHLRTPFSRKLGMGCLREDIYSDFVCISYHDYPDWWGDPAQWLDPSDCGLWLEGSIMNLLNLVKYSSDAAFKRAISNELEDYESEMIQRSFQGLISAGKLPRP
ncbi:MAG: hypothetical protein KIS92_24195 [Planctomycetota bacterium]|nr:hypothetical protein [Planctomycetota bacterium]